jgi:hypothetical protein
MRSPLPLRYQEGGLMQHIEIRIKGQIDREWADWLAGLKITHTADGSTALSGTVREQAALYGLLNSLANLGLQLVSLTSAEDSTRRTPLICTGGAIMKHENK